MSAVVPTIHVAPGACGVPVRVGVPLPRGWCAEPAMLAARDAVDGAAVPLQGRVLARWPDRSVKWLLADLLPGSAACARGGAIALSNRGTPPTASLGVETSPAGVFVDTGTMRFAFAGGGAVLVTEAVRADGAPMLGPSGVRLDLADADAGAQTLRIDAVVVEEVGPLRVVVAQRGGFAGGSPVQFVARWWLASGAASALLELRVRNPRAAVHAGGTWDLGDPGSVRLADLSLAVDPPAAPTSIGWRATPGATSVVGPVTDWALYQDSSGGECWDSVNHVEADGSPGVAFRGWTTIGGGTEPARGERAQPSLELAWQRGRVAASLQDFWQNFPKALRVRDGRLSIGLFPGERGRPIELQGGEQKRHRVAIAFGDGALDAVASLLDPPHAWVDPAWVEASGAVAGFVADLDGEPAWERHVRTVVEGPESFVARREIIDEYGWRHFGDLWADHEAVGHAEPGPFVSHYNNQYDFVLGAGLHAMRTGDARWARLARECADHTADIDVYHTDGDRPVFNGGMFWHTDHYRPARTCTHRTYSRANATSGDYGGGPSNEHDYASGLLLHHWRTGDADALEAVIGLAEWVIAMDDGARTLFGLVDAGPTGLASRTLDPDYHGPGRGAGNSIATLLDAYAATGRRRYVDKADELVQRCIHPADDIAARGLDDPERRWSYLVFLQVLGHRYLATKLELGETDYLFHYARESLLHYADWMLAHEPPYGDQLHKVELPTESWAAHDIRKCHVMHLAARWDDRGRADAFRVKAALYHDRCLSDLDGFPTRHLARPLVILTTFGHLHAHFLRLAPLPDAVRAGWRHGHDFGAPRAFVGQRDRLVRTLKDRLATVRVELARLWRDRIGRLRASRRTTPKGRTA